MASADAGAAAVEHARKNPDRLKITPNELEFMAEDTVVTIVPKFSHVPLEFISGRFGPFLPQRPAEAPLWLAITLKKRQKCRIQCPHWMTVEALEATLTAEKSEGPFSPDLPFHYMEVSSLLLANAADDITEPERVRKLLEDLYSVRALKIRNGIGEVLDEASETSLPNWVQLDHCAAMEVFHVRSNFFRAMDQFHHMVMREKQAQEVTREMSGRGVRGAGSGARAGRRRFGTGAAAVGPLPRARHHHAGATDDVSEASREPGAGTQSTQDTAELVGDVMGAGAGADSAAGGLGAQGGDGAGAGADAEGVQPAAGEREAAVWGADDAGSDGGAGAAAAAVAGAEVVEGLGGDPEGEGDFGDDDGDDDGAGETRKLRRFR